ncbi:hypothetical protein [Microbacterium rhizophilus]|uniref:hypothetical protein n=1 Tax=Microbacterium rhizophilus TaxID=3138934 RepID=UPI0031EAC83B
MSTGWAARPLVDDDTIRASTGRGWDDWAAAIDDGPGAGAGHTAIARWLVADQGVDAWWAQNVTVGYERIRGLRLPGQMPDGTFSVQRSRTVDREADGIRSALLDDAARADLLDGLDTALRSRATSKGLRFAVTEGGHDAGVVMFTCEPAGERTKLGVTHEKLVGPDEAERWKAHWADWLAAL